MKSLSRYLVVSVLLLSAVALASGALARGGHRGGEEEEQEARACAPMLLCLISVFPISTL